MTEELFFFKGNVSSENNITYLPWYMTMFFKQEILPEHLKLDLDIVNIYGNTDCISSIIKKVRKIIGKLFYV